MKETRAPERCLQNIPSGNACKERPRSADTSGIESLGALPDIKASGPAALSPSTIHLEMESGKAAEKESRVMKSITLRRDSDLERYPLRALTGHHTLSSGTKEKEESLLRSSPPVPKRQSGSSQ